MIYLLLVQMMILAISTTKKVKAPPGCDQRSQSLDFPERNLAQVISIIRMVMANPRFILLTTMMTMMMVRRSRRRRRRVKIGNKTDGKSSNYVRPH